MTDTFKLYVTGRDGCTSVSDAHIGASLLEILRDAGVYEISAMCGGNCSCAPWHVYVEAAGLLSGPDIEETRVLDTLLSRIACQVAVTAGIGSLRVEVAPEE